MDLRRRRQRMWSEMKQAGFGLPRSRIEIRVGKIGGAELENIALILQSFENFSTVSQSVQQGIALKVSVEDSHGMRLKG